MTPCGVSAWMVRGLLITVLGLAMTLPASAQVPRATFLAPGPTPAKLAPPSAVPATLPARPIVPYTVCPLTIELPAAATVVPAGGAQQVGEPQAQDAEERLKLLENANRRLAVQIRDLAKRYDALQRETRKKPTEEAAGVAPEAFGGSTLRPIRKGPFEPEEEPQRGPYVPNMPPVSRYIQSDFSNGVRWYTADDFFDLTFHNLTQVDYRDFNPTGNPLHSQFFVPRQRWYFEGKVSEWAEYYTVINRGYGTLDILDAWADINLNKSAMQLRVGRMKTPFSYEYIKVAENDLIAPERSLFIGNFSTNRQIGAMLHGILLADRLEYAAGLFNGQRRSFEDYNSSSDLILFMNTRPFLHYDSLPWLQQVNFGGSFVYGRERNPLTPIALRTANDLTTSEAAATMSPTFLAFDSNAFENGPHMQWSADFAYYVGSLGIIAGCQGGTQDYSLAAATTPASKALALGITSFTDVNSGTHTPVDIMGWNVAAFYFVTGEQVTRRKNLVEPINPLGLHGGVFGIGAIELFARYSDLQLSNNVFTSGLADPALWTNRASTTDIGVNWYLNHYIKFTFDWQHAMYGSPVFLSPQNEFMRHTDTFWFRTQLFF